MGRQDGDVAINHLNKDLKLTQPGEIASKKRLGKFKGVVAFTHDEQGQTYVRLRSIDVGLKLHSASPGADCRFLRAHMRKRIVATVLGFLELGCRSGTYRMVRQALIPDVSRAKSAGRARRSEFLSLADCSPDESPEGFFYEEASMASACLSCRCLEVWLLIA